MICTQKYRQKLTNDFSMEWREEMIKKVRNPFQSMTEVQKKKNLMITKIAAVVLFAIFYMMLFISGLYKDADGVHKIRLIAPTLVFIVSSVLLFIKIEVPELWNNLAALCFSLFIIVENYVMLQVSQGYPWHGMKLVAMEMNLYIILAMFLVIYCITNSFKAGIIGVTWISVAFGLTNYYLCVFRGTGFLAVDLVNVETAVNVAGGYSYALDFYNYFHIIIAIAITFVTLKLKRNTLTPKWWRIIPVMMCVVILGRCYYAYFVTKEFNKTFKVKYYKPQETFAKIGMYTTFARSIKDLVVEAPEGYSVSKVEELTKKYPGTKQSTKTQDAPNIIMIMDEAFTDFVSFSDIDINKDNTPFYRSMKENTIKGQLYVSIFGGGTVATEFEALTTNSMGFIPNAITVYTTYINGPMTSLADNLKAQGYGGISAMHPYRANGYKRNKVYPYFGFEKFITEPDFAADTKRVGRYISDEADFDKIISEYENYKKSSDNPFFLFNVTMQNHSPFTNGNVTGDYKLEYNLDIPQANEYMNMIKHTDNAIKKLVEYFEKQDEKTIILFFGDHQPKLEDEFYEAVNSTSRLSEANKNLEMRNTQYFLWANYDIEEDDNLDISANYLSSLLLDTAGLGKTGYQQMASQIRKQVPILTRYGYIGADGVFYKNDDKASPYYELLQQYNYAQYNNVFDTKNRVEKFFE